MWKELRRVQSIFFMLCLLFAPGVFVLGIAFDKLFAASTPTFLVAVAWMVLIGFFGFRLALWPCPRCGRPFMLRWGLFAKRCPNCKLPKWAEGGRLSA